MNLAALSVTPRSNVPGVLEARPGRAARSPRAGEDADSWDDADPALDSETADLERDDGPGRTPPRPRLSLRRLTRRHLALAAGGLVAAWIALVIAGAVADSSAVNERAAALRVENADLQARLDMTRREAELVQGDAYVSLEARAFGMGRSNERSFSLQPGAPPPPRLRLLGEDPDQAGPISPLDDWLELLFGT